MGGGNCSSNPSLAKNTVCDRDELHGRTTVETFSRSVVRRRISCILLAVSYSANAHDCFNFQL